MAKSSELLVTEREFIHRLSVITGHNKDVVRDIIKAQAEFITDELKNSIPVRLPKLGEFHVQKSTRFGGYDFVKKEKKGMITVISPKFKLSEGFKNAIHEVLPE